MIAWIGLALSLFAGACSESSSTAAVGNDAATAGEGEHAAVAGHGAGEGRAGCDTAVSITRGDAEALRQGAFGDLVTRITYFQHLGGMLRLVLVKVPEASLLARIGFEDEDVVLGVNGAACDSTARLALLLRSALGNECCVEVLRGTDVCSVRIHVP